LGWLDWTYSATSKTWELLKGPKGQAQDPVCRDSQSAGSVPVGNHHPQIFSSDRLRIQPVAPVFRPLLEALVEDVGDRLLFQPLQFLEGEALRNEAYLAGLGHRSAAIEDSRLLPLTEMIAV